MIYLVDSAVNLHHCNSLSILRTHTSVAIKLVEMAGNITEVGIIEILHLLGTVVESRDIVFCPWAIPGNYAIDLEFSQLAHKCWITTAAGNISADIEHYTPARTDNVITIGALNKSLMKASMSNFSNTKELKWVVGTNYAINDKFISGTSISSALYTAFLAEALLLNNVAYADVLTSRYNELVKL